MKRKKILSILLASAMIGTAPASAWPLISQTQMWLTQKK